MIDVVVVVSVLRRALDEQLPDALALLAREVARKRVPQFGVRDALFLKHELLDRGQRVREVRDADLQPADEIVDRAALLERQPAADAVVAERRAEYVRHVFLERDVAYVLDDRAVAREVAYDDVPRAPELVVGGHVPKVADALNEPLAALRVDAVVHRDQQRLREVQKAHARAAVAPLAGDGGLDAADGAVVVRVRLLDAARDERGDDDLVVVERRHAEAELHDLDGLVHELVREPRVVAHRQVRLRQVRLRDGAEDQVRERVDRVPFVLRLAADGDVLVERRARAELRVRPGAHLVDRKRLEPEVRQELARGVPGDQTRGEVADVIGVEVLVHAAVGERVAVRLDLQHEVHEPHGLHGLAERLGRMVRDLLEHLRHLAELLRARGPGGLRLFLGECRIAPGERPHRAERDQYALVEIELLQIFGLREVERVHARARAPLVALEPLAQHPLVVDGDVRVARGEVALGLDDAEIVEQPALGRHRGEAPVQQRVVLPERVDVPQLLLRLLGDVEHVAVALVEFVELPDDPVHRVLGKHGRGAVGGRLVAREQALGLYVDRHVLEDVLKHQRALDRERLVGMSAVALRRQYRALRADLRLDIQQRLAEAPHPGGQFAEAV
ncbi:MAG: hypothetical protein BWY81_00871 [Firmicutes bacterium ADurb.Bin467]|nr:MAG: hypothetical protein BWY81_00871 [Firmicutes bacterium ADurb.Bin467]